MAAAPVAAPAAANGSNNVLSDKVNRALHVRTDTPAMRAALAALANLSPDDHATDGRASSSSHGGVIDARSVRAAIERDALRRALDFQAELRRLAGDATALRERVDAVARMASLVSHKVEGQIVDAASDTAAAAHPGEAPGGDPLGAGAPPPAPAPVPAREQEHQLAAGIARAQKQYVEAVRRQVAVDAFLDKFDLKDDEAQILDCYNFQGFLAGAGDGFDAAAPGGGGTGGEEPGNPWSRPGAALDVLANPPRGAMEEASAFLDALERLTVIRRELTKTFGSRGGGGGGADADADALEEASGHPPAGSGGEGRLGTHSALRMMEQLASRQERAQERLYQFLQCFLGIGAAAPPPGGHHPAHVPTSSADAGRRGLLAAADAAAARGALGRFRDGDDLDEAFHHPAVRRALHVLRHSRAHEVHALELIAAGRRTEVTRRFLLALTSGYGGAASLEMKAHDPVGYVGDMLAFAFRAFRVEGELVETLLCWKDETEEGEGGGENRTEETEKFSQNAISEEDTEEDVTEEFDDDQGDHTPMSVSEMLAQSMGGLARPLRTRIAQVVASLATQARSDDPRGRSTGNEDYAEEEETRSTALDRLVAVFAVCGLLRFYASAVAKALAQLDARTAKGAGAGARVHPRDAADNPLHATCEDCLAEATEAYVASLRAFGAMLDAHARGTAESAAQLAHRAITRLAEERVASPGFMEDVAPPAEGGRDAASARLSLPFLVGAMVETAVPHLAMLDDGAALRAALDVALKCGLRERDATEPRKLILRAEQKLVASFVDTETDEVLRICGLAGLRSALRNVDAEGGDLSSHAGLSQRDVELAMNKFYSSLFSPPIPTFEDTIKDPELRKVARSRTAQQVLDVYQELYSAITSESGGYADLSFLAHDPEQVKALLSL